LSPGFDERELTDAGAQKGGVIMLAVELSEKELATLVTALESYIPDLTTERVGTDNREWHTELKEREEILGEILKRLQAIKF
jgi:hypothetical protein